MSTKYIVVSNWLWSDIVILTKDFNIVILSWMVIIFVTFFYYSDMAKEMHVKVTLQCT
jgi:hypothetical protein